MGSKMAPRLVSLVLYKRGDRSSDGPVELSASFELSDVSFFFKGAFETNSKHESRIRAERVSEGVIQRCPVEISGQKVGFSHTYGRTGIVAVAITANSYPESVAGRLLSEAIHLSLGGQAETRRASSVDELFNIFQKPEEADNICKIQNDLDEVQVLVQQSINDLLLRGETLNSLIDKSKDLSDKSKKFRKTAEKNNSCFEWIRRLFE